MSQNKSKTFQRWENEPFRWYDRFRYYLELGPSRSLTRTYRETSNKKRAKDGRPLLSANASPPKVWRDRARQFDWQSRAAAYDRHQRKLERQRVEHLQAQARALAPKAIQVLEHIMDGELKNPDGTLVEGQNCNQRRLAAEKILELTGIGALPLEVPEEDGKPDIIGIRILDQMARDDKLDERSNEPLDDLAVDGDKCAFPQDRAGNSYFQGSFT